MTYPQDGATYKHTPKWLNEAKKAESNRITPYKQSDFKPPDIFESKTQHDHARAVAREEGGTVVNPADFPEHSNLMNQLDNIGRDRAMRYMGSLSKISKQGYSREMSRDAKNAEDISDAVPRKR